LEVEVGLLGKSLEVANAVESKLKEVETSASRLQEVGMAMRDGVTNLAC